MLATTRFTEGDKVRIKTTVSDEELNDILYPLERRNGTFIIRKVLPNGYVLSNGLSVESWMLESILEYVFRIK